MTDGQQRRTHRWLGTVLRMGWPYFTVPLMVIVTIFLELVYDEEEARHHATILICMIGEHDWGDEDEYGVEPVCLRCGETRRYADV